jgi:hypothetical protein
MAMTKQQLLTVVTFVVVNFCNAMCVSMQVGLTLLSSQLLEKTTFVPTRFCDIFV